MLKICIWMNIPSHYQSAFFQALDGRDDVDLRVIYLGGISENRAAEGWNDEHVLEPFERVVTSDPEECVEQDRIQIISGTFGGKLIDWFCENKVVWCHWSEMPGIRLAELLGFRTPLYRLLCPLMLAGKRAEGLRIREYALGAFGQGRLARDAFRAMGVPESMMADLFYTPAALPPAEPPVELVTFSAGRKVFLAVGALCRRKGIDVLLRAFSRLQGDDWCLVLCGLDRADGAYGRLAHTLGIGDCVLFLGAYPVARIAAVYMAADVFVLASRFDGWGAVLNEASSAGLPMIGTDLCGAAWHVVDDGRTGFRVRAGSAKALAHAMQTYVDEPALIEQHGAAARVLFEQEFTPDHNAERFVQSCEQWLG